MAITIPDQAQVRNYLPACAEALITLATETAALDAGDVPATRQVIAGAGMTGGGALSADVTLNVIANADGSIVVNANDVQVGVLATDAQHGNRGGGAVHADATTSVAGFMSSTDKTKLDSVQAGTGTLSSGTVTISTATITASSRIQVTMTDPGAGAITGFAALKVTSKTPGAPGSFDVTAIDDAKATIATAACVFDWLVVE
jgi:hypothetical protein